MRRIKRNPGRPKAGAGVRDGGREVSDDRIKRMSCRDCLAALGCLVLGKRIAKDRDRALATPWRMTASASSIIATVSLAISCVRSYGSSSSTVVASIDT